MCRKLLIKENSRERRPFLFIVEEEKKPKLLLIYHGIYVKGDQTGSFQTSSNIIKLKPDIAKNKFYDKRHLKTRNVM